MRKSLALSLLCFSTGALFGQITDKEFEKKLKEHPKDTVDGWKMGGTVAVNLTQVSLTNWSAGGQNSIAASGLLNLFAHYKKASALWENYLDVGYGSTKSGKNTNWWKSDDKIDYTSKFGQKAFSQFYYALLLNFKTQMTRGFNYPDDSNKISDLLAPGYLLGAMGLDLVAGDGFTAFIAPLTAKITFVRDEQLADAGAFGVEQAVYNDAGALISHGEQSREEVGGYLRVFYKLPLMKNVTLQTKADLFTNYINNPQNIDVNWETLLSMKVNEFISATLQMHLLYDDDIDIAVDNDGDGKVDRNGPATQFKEVLGIGFSYKF